MGFHGLSLGLMLFFAEGMFLCVCHLDISGAMGSHGFSWDSSQHFVIFADLGEWVFTGSFSRFLLHTLFSEIGLHVPAFIRHANSECEFRVSIFCHKMRCAQLKVLKCEIE